MKRILILVLAVGFCLNVSGQESESTDLEETLEADVEMIVETGPNTTVEMETSVEEGPGTTEEDENEEQEEVEEEEEEKEESEEEEEEKEESEEETSTQTEVDKRIINLLGECPQVDNEYPTYLSDRKNCSIFYECSGGVPHKLTCRFPLQFNPDLKMCDSPFASENEAT